jgi:hypothetical protein
MQIGFHTALRLYVQLLPQCFVAVSANTQVTYILGRRELSKRNDTVSAANQWRPNGNSKSGHVCLHGSIMFLLAAYAFMDREGREVLLHVSVCMLI